MTNTVMHRKAKIEITSKVLRQNGTLETTGMQRATQNIYEVENKPAVVWGNRHLNVSQREDGVWEGKSIAKELVSTPFSTLLAKAGTIRIFGSTD